MRLLVEGMRPCKDAFVVRPLHDLLLQPEGDPLALSIQEGAC